MRILVLGAGALGGYYGGRLMQAGRDVTFLVREKRAAQLARTGLTITSPKGDAALGPPATVLTQDIRAPFDLIILTCKAYDLDSALDALAPAVGPGTLILPLLNGMRHIDALDARFGAAHVLGGQCIIPATLSAEGGVLHLGPMHSLTFGARDAAAATRMSAVLAQLSGAMFEPFLSENIMQDMWEKWVSLGTLAATTCLMRAAVGDIMASPGGEALLNAMLAETVSIATANGHAPRAPHMAQTRGFLTAPGSTFTASMLRDIEGGARIEADHVVGDLLSRRGSALAGKTPLLELAYTHLKAYEARRARGG